MACAVDRERDELIRLLVAAGQPEAALRQYGELEQLLKKRRINDRSLPAIVDAAFGYRIRRSRYIKSAGVSDQVASRDLKELVDAGLLVGKGETRGRIYDPSPLIRDVYLRNYEPRQNVDPFSQGALPFPADAVAVS